MPHATPSLEAQTRDKIGSRYAIRLREAGQLPAVMYGHGQEPAHITISAEALNDLLHHGAHLIEVKLNGAVESCLIKDVQYDYLDTTPIHADLARVDPNEEVEIEMEVEFVGRPAALDTPGAILEHPLTVITIRCKANEIPESLTHDISDMKVDDALYVSDLKLPAGVTVETDGELLMAQITVQEEEVEEEEAADATAAEPEVIGAKKEEGDAE